MKESSLVFVASLLVMLSATVQAAPEVRFGPPTLLDRFVLTNANVNLDAPVNFRSDHSGCCPGPGADEIMAILNANEINTDCAIEVYDLDGTHKRHIDLPEFDDTEGICVYDAESNLFAIVEEGLNDITIVTITTGTTSIAKSSGRTIEMGLGNLYNSGAEGVAYDASNDCFYVVIEKGSMGVYKVTDQVTNVLVETLFSAYDIFFGLCSDLSDLCYDPNSEHLFLLSQVDGIAFECTLAGDVLAFLPIAMAKPEGITLSDDRTQLYTVGEPNHYYQYGLVPRSLSVSEGVSLPFDLCLSYSAPSSSVDYVISSTSAVPGVDFAPATGTVVFAGGSTSETFYVDILNDLDLENTEHFTVTLVNPVNAEIGDDSIYECTITDPGYVDWSTIPSPQAIGIPFRTAITATGANGLPLTDFTDTVGLIGLTGTDVPEICIGDDGLMWNYPLCTSYDDARIQVIYLTNEIGAACSITGLAINVLSPVSQTMNNWTIRMKHTSWNRYSGATRFETNEWTVVYQTNQPPSAPGWCTFNFSTPFEYNALRNLMIDFSFNNSTHSAAGFCAHTGTNENRSMFGRSNSEDGDPLNWSGISPFPRLTRQIPDIRLVGYSGTPTAIFPTNCTFVNGVWTGEVTVLEESADMCLKVNDVGDSRGYSGRFAVLDAAPGEIHGNKWNDFNGNGIRDGGETGMAGWAIFLDDNVNGQLDGGEVSTITDLNGDYAFTNLAPGKYIVVEVPQTNWYHTFPADTPAETERLFAVRIDGATDTIDEIDAANGSVINSYPTPLPINTAPVQGLAVGDGRLFYIDGSDSGPHVLWELDPDTGMVISSNIVDLADPGEIWGLAYLDGKVYLQRNLYEIMVWDPDIEMVVDTFTMPSYLVGGLTGGGQRLLFDVYYDGEIVTIDPDTGAILNSFNVAAPDLEGLAYINGELLAANVEDPLTAYRINPDTGTVLGSFIIGGTGYITALGGDERSYPPGSHVVTVGLDEIATNINFGNQEMIPSGIQGNKWNDLDGDGNWDNGEPGLEGWTIFLDDNSNGLLDVAEPSTITDVSGAYSFTGLVARSYRVTELPNSKWQQTFPADEGSLAERLFASRISLFGETGTVYEINATNGSVVNSFVVTDGTALPRQGLAVGLSSIAQSEGLFGDPWLRRIDPDGGKLVSSTTVTGAGCGGLGYLDGKLYLSHHIAEEIAVWDPATEMVTATLMVDTNIRRAVTGARDRGVLYCRTAADRIVAIDPYSGAVLNELSPGVGSFGGGLAYINGELIAADETDPSTAYRIDPDTGAVLGSFTVGGEGVLTGLGGDGEMILSGRSNVIVNGGFETGDFAGWTVTSNGMAELTPWTVGPAGGGYFTNSSPRSGTFSACNGFEGGAGLVYEMYQDVSIPAFVRATLRTSHRIVYEGGPPSTSNRVFDISIRDRSNTVLSVLYTESITPNGAPYTDLGWNNGQFDVSAFADQTVRVHFREFIPEDSTGPANIEFDDIRLDIAPLAGVRKEHIIDLGWNTTVSNINFGNVLLDVELIVESAHGGAVPPAGTNVYPLGTDLACMVTNSPLDFGSTQWYCVGWTGTGSVTNGQGMSTSFALTNDSAITWNWETNFWLELTTGGNGSVDPSSEWHEAGTSVPVAALANAHYHFVEWSGSGTNAITLGDPSTSNITVTMIGPVSLAADFAVNMWTNNTPETWLAVYYPDTNDYGNAAVGDTDNDGMFAWAEYHAGTDPTNRDSVLSIVGVSADSGGIRVYWQGGTSVWQYLQRRHDVKATGEVWQSLLTNVPPTAAVTNFLDTNTARQIYYYRIKANR